jgi:FtsP/CotA-like multicopper oxidase with cupredoxin domain
LFLIHSIRFDLIALTVDVSDGSQFADVRHDDLIVELLPRCSLVQIEIRSRLHRDECHRRPENLVSPFFVTWLTGFVANSEVAQGTVFVRSKSFVTVSFLSTHEWEPFFIDMDDDDSPSTKEEFGETDWGPSMLEVGYRIGSINGKALGHGEPVRVKEGQRVLFHILNASATENIQLALPGHDFFVTALDGNPVPQPRKVPSLDLGPGERVDAIVEMIHPGAWILGSTNDDVRGAGLGVLVEYAGHSSNAMNACATVVPWDYAQFGLPRPQPPADITLPMVIARVPAGENGLERWTINGKSYRSSDSPVVLRKGVRYRFAFHNTSSDAHPLHLHRSSFELTRIDGRVTSGLLKDVVLIGAQQRIEADWTPEQEGLTLFHCHNQFHMNCGFQMLFDVR